MPEGLTGRVSVIICAYTLKRWGQLIEAVESAARQPDTGEVILTIDHSEDLFAKASETWGHRNNIRVISNTGKQGLSGARNTAVASAAYPLVAFLDDDACADPSWLSKLLEPLDADSSVVASGGKAFPIWPSEPGRWLAPETLWVVGCSYLGQKDYGAVRNVIGCSMLFRTESLASVGGFNEDTGRVGTVPLGAEETEACIWIQQKNPQAKIIFAPESIVHHNVSADRLTYKYLVRRGWYEGISKAHIARDLPKSTLSVEQSYAVMLLGNSLKYLTRGKVAYALALPSLLVATVGGYAYGLVRLSLENRTPKPSLIEVN